MVARNVLHHGGGDMRFRPTLAVLSVAVIAMATAGAFVLFDGDNDVEADGSCGDGVTWSISGTTLYIRSTTTGTGEMTDYSPEGYLRYRVEVKL